MSQRQRLEWRLAHRLAVDEHHRSRRHVEAQGAVAGHGFGPGLRPGFVTGAGSTTSTRRGRGVQVLVLIEMVRAMSGREPCRRAS